jgi:hypothetical protein
LYLWIAMTGFLLGGFSHSTWYKKSRSRQTSVVRHVPARQTVAAAATSARLSDRVIDGNSERDYRAARCLGGTSLLQKANPRRSCGSWR